MKRRTRFGLTLKKDRRQPESKLDEMINNAVLYPGLGMFDPAKLQKPKPKTKLIKIDDIEQVLNFYNCSIAELNDVPGFEEFEIVMESER